MESSRFGGHGDRCAWCLQQLGRLLVLDYRFVQRLNGTDGCVDYHDALNDIHERTHHDGTVLLDLDLDLDHDNDNDAGAHDDNRSRRGSGEG